MPFHHNREASPPNRVVVIGSGGFIGKALIDNLNRLKIPILGISRQDIDLCANDADEALSEKLDSNDTVVMLSAVTPDKGSDVRAFENNISIGASVCHAIETVKPAHVVYFGSDAAYPFVEGMVSEQSDAVATDLYSAAHIAREIMFKRNADCPLAILRPTLIFGSQDPHNSYGPNRLRRAAQKEQEITVFGNGEEKRDHIYINDVIGLTTEMILHKTEGILNLATGNSISYFDLAGKIAENFEEKIEINCTERQNAITHRHFDITELLKLFPGFKFTPFSTALKTAHQEMLLDHAE